MRHTIWKLFVVLGITALLINGCSSYQGTKYNAVHGVNLDTVRAGQFDTGKMWTFDFPPVDYFQKTYGFTPSKEWFEKARLSSLRLPNCTASFVSEDGLVMTNHHCARAALDSVTRDGEQLVERGFYATTLEEERKAPNIYVDQLLVMEDVTIEVQQAFESGPTVDAKIANRAAKMKDIQKRFAEKYKTVAPNDSMVFSVVSFYNGGRFSLYGYKRYTDVRLVYAPEELMGFFGGDPDNFTYPRYDFDCSFFRVYENARPMKSSNFFLFSQNGAKEGEAVFVIGNPGSTSRLETMAQLNFRRDFVYPTNMETYKKYEDIYSSYVDKHPEEKDKYMNRIFGYANSRKATTGYLQGLLDPVIMAKKRNFEKKFQDAVFQNTGLHAKYGNPWADIEEYQNELAQIYQELNSLRFRGRLRTQYLSLALDLVDLAKHSKGTIPDSARLKFYPSNIVPEIEKDLLAFRLDVLRRTLGTTNEALNALLAGRTPQNAAEELASSSIIASKEKTGALLARSTVEILNTNDPLIKFVIIAQQRFSELQKKYDGVNERLQASVQILGKAMYDIYGTQIPPDATFTLRIADGTVKGYEYNGTLAPPLTTFYGMYDRYYSFGMQAPWKLPERWTNPPASFKMSTPMNFVSTNDIIGGNSGSPVINKDLQVVGLIFDGNMESLPGNIIFDETKNRSISVHSSGILEGLEQIYKSERIAKELRAGKIMP
jgi:hypothetical protein